MKHLSKVLNVTLISYIGEMVTSQNMKILLIDKVRIEVHVILLAASNNISLSYRINVFIKILCPPSSYYSFNSDVRNENDLQKTDYSVTNTWE